MDFLAGLLSPRTWARYTIAERFAERDRARAAAEAAQGVDNVMASQGYKGFLEANPSVAPTFGLWSEMARQPGMAGVANSALITGLSHQWSMDRSQHAADVQFNAYKRQKEYDLEYAQKRMQVLASGVNDPAIMFDYVMGQQLGPAGTNYMWTRDPDGGMSRTLNPNSPPGLEAMESMQFLENAMTDGQELLRMIEQPDRFTSDYFNRGEIQNLLQSLVYGQARAQGQGDVGEKSFDQLVSLVIGDPEAANVMRQWYYGKIGNKSPEEIARSTEIMRGALVRFLASQARALNDAEARFGFDARGNMDRGRQSFAERAPFAANTLPLGRGGAGPGEWWIGNDPGTLSRQYKALRGVKDLDAALEGGGVRRLPLPAPDVDQLIWERNTQRAPGTGGDVVVP